MAKQNILLEGRNIYYDKHNRPILYVKRQKRGYRIPAEHENMYKTLSLRYVISAIIFIFAYILFELNIWFSLGLTITAFAILEWRYRHLLDRFTIIENYEPELHSKSKISTDTNMSGLVLRLCLYIIFGVLIVVNAFLTPGVRENNEIKVVSIGVSIVSLYFAYRYLDVIIKKLKANKGK